MPEIKPMSTRSKAYTVVIKQSLQFHKIYFKISDDKALLEKRPDIAVKNHITCSKGAPY